jgi:hypothetical protein
MALYFFQARPRRGQLPCRPPCQPVKPPLRPARSPPKFLPPRPPRPRPAHPALALMSGVILQPAQKPAGCAHSIRCTLCHWKHWFCHNRLSSSSLLASPGRLHCAGRLNSWPGNHTVMYGLGDVLVPVRCEVDWIVLPPQSVSGTGGSFPQAKIAWIRKQCWVKYFETEIMFDRPVLQDFFNSF